jgi:septal ring factor EnvC (AmiA/AmiB activator)
MNAEDQIQKEIDTLKKQLKDEQASLNACESDVRWKKENVRAVKEKLDYMVAYQRARRNVIRELLEARGKI